MQNTQLGVGFSTTRAGWPFFIMKIKILFFSLLRDLTGTDCLETSFDGNTVADLLKKLYQDIPKLSEWDANLLIAVNSEYATRETAIKEGDEIAIMPPVQGG